MCPDFPKIGGASAADVWAYGTRQLNADGLNAIRDAILSDATLIPGANIDALISSRATQAQILSDAVPFPGANVDAAVTSRAAIADYSATRAAKLDKIQDFLEEAFGSLLMDGTEQTVKEILTTINKLHCFVDLTPMLAGDIVVVRQYMQILTAGSFIKYAEETYNDVQALPLLYVITKPARYGIRITLQQTAGTYKTFDWETFQEKAA